MNDEKLRELFVEAEPAEEPPLPPGYLESTLTRAHRTRRRRQRRRAAVGTVVAVAVLGAAGLLVQPQLPGRDTPRVPAADTGGGDYDPLIQRLDPGWLPRGANLHEQSVENRVQNLRFEHWTGTGRDAKPTWAVELYLYPPGVGTAADGPLEHADFGDGGNVARVQGMPTEHLPDPNGYTLAWQYASGAHAVVTIENGFGDRTATVARKVADNLRIDGNTPLRFPFTLSLPPGQHVTAAVVTSMTDADGTPETNAILTFGASARLKTWSSVQASSHLPKGDKGKNAAIRHGFLLQVSTAHGVDPDQVMRQLRIVGKPHDLSTWRAHPVRH